MIPLLVLFSIPASTFYLFDPFKILNEYEDFNNSIVGYNEDYVTTERFLKRNTQYNSFIFGSSRAGVGFQINEWESTMNKEGKAYSFTASNESIFGILGKIRLIDEEKCKINDALIIIDTDMTLKKIVNSNGHLYIKHPRVSNESKDSFISTYLKDYIFTGFFIRYLDYKLFKTQRSYMNGFLSFENINPNEKYLPFNLKKKEDLIQSNKLEYYERRKGIFYTRNLIEQQCSKTIEPKCISFLTEIRDVFSKHNTRYRIVVSPLYDQQKIHDTDLNILNKIFGKENVFDFSGKNSITNDKHNYYENSHYRANVGNHIMQTLYAPPISEGH